MSTMSASSEIRYPTEISDVASVEMILRIDSIERTSLKRRKMRKARSTESGKGSVTVDVESFCEHVEHDLEDREDHDEAVEDVHVVTRTYSLPSAIILTMDSKVKMPVRTMLMLGEHPKVGLRQVVPLGVGHRVDGDVARLPTGCGEYLSIMTSVLKRMQPCTNQSKYLFFTRLRHICRKPLACSSVAMAFCVASSPLSSLTFSSPSLSAISKLSQSTARNRLITMIAPKSTRMMK